MLTAVAGINWGDEGKGRIISFLADDYDIICRFQGGNKVGFNITHGMGETLLNLLPSGVFRKNVVNVMGSGMVIDLENLCSEMDAIRDLGLDLTPDNLKISSNAFICMPYHRLQDNLEKERIGDDPLGSVRRGITPVFGDKYMKKGIRLSALLDKAELEYRLVGMLQWKNLSLCGYGSQTAKIAENMEWLNEFGSRIIPFITDTSDYLFNAATNGKKILFETQLGALCDIDYGVYPYTSSYQTLASFAPIGAGIPGSKLNLVVGVMKAFSTTAGKGPFITEMPEPEAEKIRETGEKTDDESEAKPARVKRIGWLDLPVVKYAATVNGFDELAVCKIDKLDNLSEIKVCIGYKLNGEEIDYMPSTREQLNVVPVYEVMKGWMMNTSKIDKIKDLPANAKKYIELIEKIVGVPVKYVGVGPGRSDIAV